jgi:hypothetical protein
MSGKLGRGGRVKPRPVSIPMIAPPSTYTAFFPSRHLTQRVISISQLLDNVVEFQERDGMIREKNPDSEAEFIIPEELVPMDDVPLRSAAVGSRMLTNSSMDVMNFFRDTFNEELERSRAVKRKVAAFIPDALRNISEVLGEDLTDKNRMAKVNLSQWVLEKGMIEAEMPRLQMSLIKTERESRTMQEVREEFKPTRVSEEKMEEFLRIATGSNAEILLLKSGGEDEVGT